MSGKRIYSNELKLEIVQRYQNGEYTGDFKVLLAEVQRLRMENEYLKNLNALVQEREKSEKKTKQLSFRS